jgi:hypothetical protein
MLTRKIGSCLAVVAMIGAGVAATAAPAAAETGQECRKIYTPSGMGGKMCKTWTRIGSTAYFNGKWWSEGPFPTKIELKVIEDGWQHSADFSGSYQHRKLVQLKLCDSLTGKCGTPW